MKKIKFMFVAFMAMIGVNAMATDTNVIINGTVQSGYTAVTTDYTPSPFHLKYTVTNLVFDGTTVKKATVSVTKGAELGTTASITIPEKIEFVVKLTHSTPANSIDQAVEFTVTSIENNAFKGTSLTSVTLPAKLEAIGSSAFEELEIEEITLPTTLKAIGNSAFKGTGIESISIPASVETIGTSAFEDCATLNEVTLAASSNLYSIGDGAFAYTSLTELNLSSATAYDNDPTDTTPAQGMTSIGAIFTSTGTPQNGIIRTVVLPTTCATINNNAFKKCKKLATIDLSNVKSIGTSAFEDCAKLATVAIGTKATFGTSEVLSIGGDAFKGCTSLTTVELGKIGASSITGSTTPSFVSGITTLTFNKIAGAIANLNLATITSITFNEYITDADYVPANTFTNAFVEGGTVTYNVTIPSGVTTPALNMNAAAFSADADAERTITMTVSKAIKDELASATVLNKVLISGDWTVDGNIYIGNGTTDEAKKLIKDINSDNYYYYFYGAAGNNYKIARANEGDAKVSVYQVYVDGDANTIYYQPMVSKDGYFYVEAQVPVIIKSTKENRVVAVPVTATDANNTMVYGKGGAVVNDLKFTATKLGLVDIASNPAFDDKDIYFFANPSKAGFGFSLFNSSVNKTLQGVYFLVDAAVAGARMMQNVWLDEDGNVTAIDKVQINPANDDAIYNMAGQKVSASYKGFVIKNGKKYIQK